jgi:hypothetical protein
MKLLAEKNTKASDVFKDLLLQNSAYSKNDLAVMLMDQFPEMTGEAVQAIWYWRSPTDSKGLSDAELDSYIDKYLKDAGYKKE